MTEALVFVKKVCVCKKEFETTNDSDKCYDCVLEGLTNGWAPEEGDFNSARIISGTMTALERENLQKDLEEVESGTSSLEPAYDFEDNDDDWDDPAWCDDCNKDTAFCTCDGCPACGEYHEHCTC